MSTSAAWVDPLVFCGLSGCGIGFPKHIFLDLLFPLFCGSQVAQWFRNSSKTKIMLGTTRNLIGQYVISTSYRFRPTVFWLSRLSSKPDV
jgi:hypothetical protein